jgi:deglycase
MSERLKGRRVAFLATDGVEQAELTEPLLAVEGAGATSELVSIHGGEIQGVNHGEPGDTFEVDRGVVDVDEAEFDALVLPGGVANPDKLRMDERAVSFVRAFFEAGKPVASICHGAWMLVEAGVVAGRTLTSYPSLRTDIQNAGGTWVDERVKVDHGLVTSRNPDDLPAFCEKLVEEFARGPSAEQIPA